MCPGRQKIGLLSLLLLLTIPAVSATIGINASPLLVTAGDPQSDRYITSVGRGFDGVARVIINREDANVLCSGSLLSSGRHLLTAAHCISDAGGNVTALSSEVTFTSVAGEETIEVSTHSAHPDWSGDFLAGGDLAVLTLMRPASSSVDRYGLFRDTTDIGAIAELVGYGLTGTGATGIDIFDGQRRHGRNRLDATMETTLGLLQGGGTGGAKVLIADFDDGSAQHDALDFTFGITDRGLGLDEVLPAPGDSGGPGLIGNRIAAVSSFAARIVHSDGSTADVDSSPNWSTGELSGFTRVSVYQDWIDSQVTPIPEPSTLSLAFIAFCGITVCKYRRKFGG